MAKYFLERSKLFGKIPLLGKAEKPIVKKTVFKGNLRRYHAYLADAPVEDPEVFLKARKGDTFEIDPFRDTIYHLQPNIRTVITLGEIFYTGRERSTDTGRRNELFVWKHGAGIITRRVVRQVTE